MWGEASKFASSRLVVLQKCATRLISNTHYLAHTNPLFNQFQLLKLNHIYTFQLLVFMYRTKHDLLPPACTYATLNTTNCSYNLRKGREFTSVPFRTIMRKKHLTYSGPYPGKLYLTI